MMKEFEKMGEKVEPSPVIVAAFTRAGKHVTCSATDPVRYISQQDDFQDVMDGMMRQVRSLCELDDEGSNTDHCNRDEYSCRQLLSKEVMYEPMRQICERVNYLFVKYQPSHSFRIHDCASILSGCRKNKTSCPRKIMRGGFSIPIFRYVVPLDIYSVCCRYGKQYQYFQKIVAAYEVSQITGVVGSLPRYSQCVRQTEPDNFPRLTELMQDVRLAACALGTARLTAMNARLQMQETGQPPSEIVKDLAPGVWSCSAGLLCYVVVFDL